MFCIHCSAENLDGSLFCVECGEPLDTGREGDPPPPPRVATPRPEAPPPGAAGAARAGPPQPAVPLLRCNNRNCVAVYPADAECCPVCSAPPNRTERTLDKQTGQGPNAASVPLQSSSAPDFVGDTRHVFSTWEAQCPRCNRVWSPEQSEQLACLCGNSLVVRATKKLWIAAQDLDFRSTRKGRRRGSGDGDASGIFQLECARFCGYKTVNSRCPDHKCGCPIGPVYIRFQAERYCVDWSRQEDMIWLVPLCVAIGAGFLIKAHDGSNVIGGVIVGFICLYLSYFLRWIFNVATGRRIWIALTGNRVLLDKG